MQFPFTKKEATNRAVAAAAPRSSLPAPSDDCEGDDCASVYLHAAAPADQQKASQQQKKRLLTELTCVDQTEIVLAVAGVDCPTLVGLGFCTSMCPTCGDYAGYCDLSCGFCSPPTAAPTPSLCLCECASETSAPPTPTPLPTSNPTSSATGDGCFDIDREKVNTLGYGCEEFYTITTCGQFDDQDFSSMEMCCVCGGGEYTQFPTATPLPTPSPTLSPTPAPTLTAAPTVTPAPTTFDNDCESDGTVGNAQRLQSESELTFVLNNGDQFGISVIPIGDLNGDGVDDLAVGSNQYDGSTSGTLHILFMSPDGTVASASHIDSTHGNLNRTITLNAYESFASALATIHGIEGDGVCALAVGAPNHRNSTGAFYIVMLNTDGTVSQAQEISNDRGGLPFTLTSNDHNDWGDEFGSSVASLGDVNDDGVGDLAVGAPGDSDGSAGAFSYIGAVYILRMNSDGTVSSATKLSNSYGDLPFVIIPRADFGSALATLEDVNGDGVNDLVVGARSATQDNTGAVFILFLDATAAVISAQEISNEQGNLNFTLSEDDWFGASVAFLSDLNNDGVPDLAVGAEQAESTNNPDDNDGAFTCSS